MSSVLHSDGSSESIAELTSLWDENKENVPPNGLQSKKKVVMPPPLSSSSVFDDKENIPPQGLQFSISTTSEDKENSSSQGLKQKRKEMLRPILSISSISIDGKENIPLQALHLRKQKILHPELPPLVQPEDLEKEISKTKCINRFFGWILRGSSVDQLTDACFFGCRLIKQIFWVNLPRACKLMLSHFGILGHFIGPSLDDATCEVVDGLTNAAVHLNTCRKRRYASIIGPQRDMLGIQSAVVPSPIRSLSSAALQFASDRQSEVDCSD